MKQCDSAMFSVEKPNSVNHEVLYVYCLAPAERITAAIETGVDEKAAVCLHRFRDLVAVLSFVSLEEFSGEEGEKNLSDISWVGPRACRHGKVVCEAARCSPILPLRFGTIFSSQQVLDRFLENHHQNIRGFLKRIDEHEEWSVKGVLNRKMAKNAILALRLTNEEERLAALPPGRRYLEEQRIQGKVDREISTWLRDTCRSLTTDLVLFASDCRQRSLVPQSSVETEMVLNLAFLINRDDVPPFCSKIAWANGTYEAQGLSFQLSGPWPPYSFTPSLADNGEQGREAFRQ